MYKITGVLSFLIIFFWKNFRIGLTIKNCNNNLFTESSPFPLLSAGLIKADAHKIMLKFVYSSSNIAFVDITK